MASGVVAGFPYRALLFGLVLLPWASTDPQLAINNRTDSFQIPTKPDQVASLWCMVQNHIQGEELVWFRGDKQVQLSDGNKVNTSNVCVSPVSPDDNGVSFTCKLARNVSVQVSVELDVRFSPILSGEPIHSVQEETDATLSCHTKANPPAQMSWIKDNLTLTLEKSHHQIYQTSELFQLTITKVQKSDSGIYTCRAESELGAETKDFHLTVEDKQIPFPLEAVIAACVVIFLTLFFGIVARRHLIVKCFKNKRHSVNNTSL